MCKLKNLSLQFLFAKPVNIWLRAENQSLTVYSLKFQIKKFNQSEQSMTDDTKDHAIKPRCSKTSLKHKINHEYIQCIHGKKHQTCSKSYDKHFENQPVSVGVSLLLCNFLIGSLRPRGQCLPQPWPEIVVFHVFYYEQHMSTDSSWVG